MKNLVIVESPAKAKTIEKFLGKDYKVLSSYGHIRDLSKKEIHPDDEADTYPAYEIPADKKDLVKTLKKAAKEASMVWLASDEDREGEAIAWHLYEVLGLKPENTKRIVFHEITKPAILAAIENPRDIDIDRVNAQQARRVLDRIVGFELSPVLWRKIKPSLSAGRVQSVAVRLICEREKEIDAFKSESYFRVTGRFSLPSGAEVKGESLRRLPDEASALSLLNAVDAATKAEAPMGGFKVTEVKVNPLRRSPAPPFTTSTLQQEASRRLGFSVNQTMMLAQKLYEDGHITYMRTDSLNLSALALRDIAAEVESDFGKEYLKVRKYHTHSKGAQEAHEAIRPTYINKKSVGSTEQERRLYTLIRRRAIASQMADAELEKTLVDIAADGVDATFRAEGEVVKFEGFMKVYRSDSDTLEKSDSDTLLPPLAVGESLGVEEVAATQRFSQPPARYTEATLVKKMEDLGIGRPSTYAPTISTIQHRDYIKRGEREGEKRDYEVITLAGGHISKTTMTETTGSDKGKLVPTDVGMIVNDFLTEHFPDILDYNFTARVEEKFDEIAEGKLGWKNEISDFYGGFHPSIERINDLRMDRKVGERQLGVDPKTGRPVSVKIGRYGPVVQIGEATDEEKPLFASLASGQSIATITLEEALKLFDLPRTLGDFEDKTVVAAVGRFGPYIRHAGAFVSIPKGMAPETISLDEAIELIRAKREKDAANHLKDYPEIPGLSLLKGRFGPYLAYKPEGAKKAVNYRLPKGADPLAMTIDEIRSLMEAQDAAPKKKKGK
ncbi:MAG: type I DNA topoisomerase [Muribaculaceae bacterium]|nr:type I DNA topoisomerase [Muribaculaceae bacterium]